MSFNKFTVVRITDDRKKLQISGDSPEIVGRGLTEIRVAVAARPAGVDPVEVLQHCEFDHARPLTGADLQDGWTAEYEMKQVGEYVHGQPVVVVGGGLSAEGTDVWADTFEILTMGETKPQIP